MKRRTRSQVVLCFLGALQLGPAALAQQDPRAVVVRPSTTAKATGTKPSRAPAPRAAPAAKRYWADYAGNTIRRSDLDGSNAEVVATDASGPYGVTYDAATDSILWTSAGDEVVQMAPASGSGPTVTLNTSFAENFAIVINGSERNVAYGVQGAQVIRITQDRNTGTEQRDVLYTLPAPDQVHGLALAPDGSALYLGDTAGRMTQKLNLATGQMVQLVYDNGSSAPAPSTASQPRPASQEKTR